MTNYNSKWEKVSNGGNLNNGTLESIFGLPLFNGKTSIPRNNDGQSYLANQYIMLSKIKMHPKTWLIFPLQTADTLLEIGERKDKSSEPYLKFNGTFKNGKLIFLAKRSIEDKMEEMTFNEFRNEIQKYFELNSFEDFQKYFDVDGLSNEYKHSIRPLLNPSFSGTYHDLKVNIFGKRKS